MALPYGQVAGPNSVTQNKLTLSSMIFTSLYELQHPEAKQDLPRSASI